MTGCKTAEIDREVGSLLARVCILGVAVEPGRWVQTGLEVGRVIEASHESTGADVCTVCRVVVDLTVATVRYDGLGPAAAQRVDDGPASVAPEDGAGNPSGR